MCHDPKSKILGRYFLELANVLNLVAVGLGEEIEGQYDQLQASLYQQLLYLINETLVQKSQGPALNIMVRESLDGDPAFRALGDPREIKNYTSRTR